MTNPFKFGTIVDGEYFTDRREELKLIQLYVSGPNHVILISPRRFGKTSLVKKALISLGRPYVFVNLQSVVSVTDFAASIIKEALRHHKWERLKYEISQFRIVPTLSTSPFGDGFDVSFHPMQNPIVALEDSFAMLERLSNQSNRLIVVLDEFQDIVGLGHGIEKRLRAILQEQKNINYIFLGSQESMMTEIFERKKSPFYHFGQLMRLSKIPYDDLKRFIAERLPSQDCCSSDEIADSILSMTGCHPYYTQQLASQVWGILAYQSQQSGTDVVEMAIDQLTEIHDLDFERVWINFNNTDRRVLKMLCETKKPLADRSLPTSTTYSALKRLMRAGYVTKVDNYEIDDPFFRRWLIARRM